MIRYTWADVMKTIMGIQWKSEPIRRAALIIHWSLVDKKYRLSKKDYGLLPFDDKEDSNTSTISRLKQRQLELRKQNSHA